MNLSAMAYPKDSRDFIEVISNGEGDNGRYLALASMTEPCIILFVAIMLGFGFIAAISGCCCFLVKQRRGDIEKRPSEIVVIMDCENDKGYIF